LERHAKAPLICLEKRAIENTTGDFAVRLKVTFVTESSAAPL
jgi:hypothetical protein